MSRHVHQEALSHNCCGNRSVKDKNKIKVSQKIFLVIVERVFLSQFTGSRKKIPSDGLSAHKNKYNFKNAFFFLSFFFP